MNITKLLLTIVWIVSLLTALAAPHAALADEGARPRIGFTTALTGDGALSGVEMMNAAILGNELLAGGVFDIRFADERCMGAPAAAAAQKFVTVDRIDYAMGFFCNVALLTAAPIYVKAKVPVLSTCATTMDTPDVGEGVYRLFPADQLSIPVLYDYVQSKYHRVGILAEEDAYAQMLRKEFERLNAQAAVQGRGIAVFAEDYPFEATDLRSLLLRLKQREVQALFIDSATEPTFIRIVKQMHEMGFKSDIVGVYTPVSRVAKRELGALLNGAVAATLPDFSQRSVHSKAKELLAEYEKRFGAPQAAFPVVLTTLEAMRLVSIAHSEGRPMEDVVRDPEVLKGSLIGPYQFDRFGAAQGIPFVLETAGTSL